MGLSMKVIGRKINRMVLGKKVGQMVHRMKVIISKGKKVDMVFSNGLMEAHMKVNLKIII